MPEEIPGGTAVQRYLFSPLYYPRTGWSVVRWWESRRLFYNVVVAGAGVVTLAAGFFFASLPPFPGHFRGVGLVVLIYGAMANLFYSFGAPVDLFLRRLIKENGGPVAQALFRYGVAFAIGLTLLPIPLMAIGWILRWFIR
jgi:hypothetical protein